VVADHSKRYRTASNVHATLAIPADSVVAETAPLATKSGVAHHHHHRPYYSQTGVCTHGQCPAATTHETDYQITTPLKILDSYQRCDRKGSRCLDARARLENGVVGNGVGAGVVVVAAAQMDNYRYEPAVSCDTTTTRLEGP
jgi:hypothetical protein